MAMYRDEDQFRSTELASRLNRLWPRFRAKRAINNQMVKCLSKAEVYEWQLLEHRYQLVGLTSYEFDKMFSFLIKAGLLVKVEEGSH